MSRKNTNIESSFKLKSKMLFASEFKISKLNKSQTAKSQIYSVNF